MVFDDASLREPDATGGDAGRARAARASTLGDGMSTTTGARASASARAGAFGARRTSRGRRPARAIVRASAGASASASGNDGREEDVPRAATSASGNQGAESAGKGSAEVTEATVTSASASTLDTQIATTQRLREEFESDPFMTQSSVRLAQNAEYDNDVHAVRGAEAYRTLMKRFGEATGTALTKFKFITRRASSIEPGVLLIQWTAEWEGAPLFGKKFSNTLLSSMHEGAVRRLVEGEYGEKLAPGYPLANEGKKVHDMKCRLFGRTTYKVNREGDVVSRLDRIDFRTDPPPGSESEDEFFMITPEEEEEEWERLAEETAVNMFYNTLCPPDKNETSWFLDVLIELEWQSFQRQMGDTTSVLTKQEYVSVIYAVLASAIAAPILICVGLAMLFFSPEQAPDPDSLEAAMSMDLATPETGANGSPIWGPEIFLDLYKGKIGAL
jgi:hypothetical protein